MNIKKPPTGQRGAILAALVFSIVVSLLLYGLLPVFATHDGRDEHLSTNTREGRLAVFDDVWKTINERYYDPTFKGLDWDGPRSAFRLAAAEADGTEELYEVLRRMIESLNDPHTRIYSPDKKSDWWRPRFVSVGLAIREIEDVPTVVQVEPGSAPARAGIKPGDEIESVDEVPVSQIIRQKLGEQSHSHASKSVRYRVVASLLEGEPGSFLQLGWKGRNGSLKSATFQRYLSQRQLGFQISSRDKYLMVEIQTFTQELVLAVVRELKGKLRGVRGVILDLRGNGGGDAYAMASIASVFLGDGVELGKFTDRVGSTFQLTTYAISMFVSRPAAQADLPMIALVSESTSSAAEILASALQRRRRARLIGTSTCGCVLAIRSRHTLPDKGVLDVSEFDYLNADGIRLEGRGVQPDELIPPQRRDFYLKRDRALETALAMLKRNAHHQPRRR